MLVDFIRLNYFVIFVQEVTIEEILNVHRYETYLNIRASPRGKVILARSMLHLTNITTLPSGRAIATDYREYELKTCTNRSEGQAESTENIFIMPSCHTCFTTAQRFAY